MTGTSSTPPAWHRSMDSSVSPPAAYAADVAFAAVVGAADLTSKEIAVIDLDRTEPDDGTTTAAIATA